MAVEEEQQQQQFGVLNTITSSLTSVARTRLKLKFYPVFDDVLHTRHIFRMSIDLRKNQDAIIKAYNDVVNDKTDTNW